MNKQNTTMITGPLYEVGAINKNGWGISASEVERVLESIVGNPLKICSGEAHSCDYQWTDAAIGKVVGAKLENGWIHATAEVIDPRGARKIADGTWPNTWSGFLTHRSQKSEGMLKGIGNKAVTLVRHPAYPAAGFKVIPDFVIQAVNRKFNEPAFQNELKKAAGLTSEGQTARAQTGFTIGRYIAGKGYQN